MKKYLQFVNEGLFDFLKRKKFKEDEEISAIEEPKKVKPKKYENDSDQDMEELVEEIKNTFSINNLKWLHSDFGKIWRYRLNGVEIELRCDKTGSKNWKLQIKGKSVETSLISDKYFEELYDLFFKCMCRI